MGLTRWNFLSTLKMRMRQILIITFFSLLLPVRAGNVKDTIDIRVQYHATYKNTVEKNYLYEDDNMLEIGRRVSKFYSMRFYQFVCQDDSFKQAGNTGNAYSEFLHRTHGAKRGASYTVYKNYPAPDRLTYVDVILTDYYFMYQEDLPKIEWNLLEEGDTIIAGYKCHKASGEWRGRTWTAWYAMDLPYPDGPWKLNGLPGLILAAKEQEGIFSFNCIGIEQTGRAIPITYDKRKWQETAPRKYQDVLKDFWYDQANFALRMMGVSYQKIEEIKTFHPCLMEFY